MPSSFLGVERKAQILAGLAQAGVPQAEAEEVVAVYEEVKRPKPSPPAIPPRPTWLASRFNQSVINEPELALKSSSPSSSRNAIDSSKPKLKGTILEDLNSRIKSLPQATEASHLTPRVPDIASSKIDILLIDEINGRFALIAQAYLEILRVLHASGNGSWLFHRAATLGIAPVLCPRASTFPSREALDNVEVTWRSLPRWSELPANGVPFEKAHIMKNVFQSRLQDINHLPIPASYLNVRYIFAWHPVHVALLHQGLPTHKPRPEIRLLPRPDLDSDASYIPFICESIEQIVKNEIIRKGIEKNTEGGNGYRTKFMTIRLHGQSDAWNRWYRQFAAYLRKNTECKLFNARYGKEHGEEYRKLSSDKLVVLVGPVEALRPAEEALVEQLRTLGTAEVVAEAWKPGEREGDWEGERLYGYGTTVAKKGDGGLLWQVVKGLGLNWTTNVSGA